MTVLNKGGWWWEPPTLISMADIIKFVREAWAETFDLESMRLDLAIHPGNVKRCVFDTVYKNHQHRIVTGRIVPDFGKWRWSPVMVAAEVFDIPGTVVTLPAAVHSTIRLVNKIIGYADHKGKPLCDHMLIFKTIVSLAMSGSMRIVLMEVDMENPMNVDLQVDGFYSFFGMDCQKLGAGI